MFMLFLVHLCKLPYTQTLSTLIEDLSTIPYWTDNSHFLDNEKSMYFGIVQPSPMEYPKDFKTYYSIRVPDVLVARARNNYLNLDLFEVRCNQVVINIEVDGIEQLLEEDLSSAAETPSAQNLAVPNSNIAEIDRPTSTDISCQTVLSMFCYGTDTKRVPAIEPFDLSVKLRWR